MKVPWTYRAALSLDRDISRNLEVDAELVALGNRDTVLTPALSQEQTDRLILAFGSTVPKRVYFAGVAESGANMRGTARDVDIRRFARQCGR